jgi:hypothetical protein
MKSKLTLILISILISSLMLVFIPAAQAVADEISIVEGTYNSGDIDSVLTRYDDDYYQVTETVGVPGFDIRINFTQAADWESFTMREWYTGTANHDVDVQLWNFSSGAWVDYLHAVDSDRFLSNTILVPEFEDHTSSGNLVWMRFYHADAGNINHVIRIDYVALNSVGAGEDWLDGWEFRKQIVVAQTAGAGTNYQMEFDLRWAVGADSGSTIYLNGNSQLNFSDVRFTRADSETLLDHYLSNTVDGINTTAWVEIAGDLSADPATIYLYYGNSTVSDVSNATNTFIDVFGGVLVGASNNDGSGTTVEDGTGNDGIIVGGMNYNWITSGTVRGGAINYTVGDTWTRFPNKAAFNVTTEWSMVGWIYHYSTLGYLGQRNIAATGLWVEILAAAGGMQTFQYVSGVKGLGYYVSVSNAWNHVGATYESGVIYNLVLNGSTVASRADVVGSVTQNAEHFNSGAGGVWMIDEILYFDNKLSDAEIASIYNNHGDPYILSEYCMVRKWLDPVPIFESGSEEDEPVDESVFALRGELLAALVIISLILVPAILLIIVKGRR